MRARAGLLSALLVLALIVGTGYAAYAGDRVYQNLQSGRDQLALAQASINGAQQTGDLGQIREAAASLVQAERDFAEAQHRARTDPGLRLVAAMAIAGRQIDGAAHLAAIGVELSRAGEAAAAIAEQVGQLKRQYAGHRLTPDDLQAIVIQVQAIATNYQGSIDQIGRQLRAAREERARVTTTDLLSPLRNAYDQVDRALADADTAFLRYQDVRQVLAQLLDVALPA